ncbi:MAG TPA: hypothetical protein VHK26_01620 [Methyloceanibacter sp.]|jgi:hypothetical protein|nr:hypothetical protein [Methyloceanibacter sp.]
MLRVKADMPNDFGSELTPAELRDLRRLVGFMVPSSADYRVPGANDGTIFADIVRSLGRDQSAVRKALAMLREMVGGDFAAIDEAEAEATAMALLRREGPEITALGRAVLQCYYRDERVIRSLGLEPGPPFPKGHTVQQGDWSLLEAVRNRPPMWRDVDDKGR